MKKTRSLICATALLLAALMLFSACSVNYRTADTAEYISIAEADFNRITMSVDKMLVDDNDVQKAIDDARFEKKQPKKNGAGEIITDDVGAVSQYDVVDFRVILYDKQGNLVSSDFELDAKATTSNGNSPVLESYKSLPIAYPGDKNTGLNKKIEDVLYNGGTDALTLLSHQMIFVNSKEPAGVPADADFFFLKYASTYATTVGGSNSEPGTSATDTQVLHTQLYRGKEQGKNSYMEAIYLALTKHIAARKEADPNAGVKPSLTDTIHVYVYPTSMELPAVDESDKASRVHISYDMDFSNPSGGANYTTGYISVTLSAAAYMKEGAAPLKMEYTFDATETGKYKLNGKDTSLANVTVDAYVYLIGKVGYTYPDYDETFIRETMKFSSDATTWEALDAAYRKSIKDDLQATCDQSAKVTAMNKLWQYALSKTSLIKEPSANAKDYRKEQIEYYKYLYYDAGYRDKTTGTGENKKPLYNDFEDFILSSYKSQGTDYGTYANLESALYSQGLQIAKENLLTYHLADALGVRMTEEQLHAMLVEKGTAWAKSQIDAVREQYAEKVSDTADEKSQKQLMLQYYFGVNSVSEIPEDLYTWETYAEQFGEENLYGAYQLDAVMEKLYEVNLAAGTLTLKDVDYVAPAKTEASTTES